MKIFPKKDLQKLLKIKNQNGHIWVKEKEISFKLGELKNSIKITMSSWDPKNLRNGSKSHKYVAKNFGKKQNKSPLKNGNCAFSPFCKHRRIPIAISCPQAPLRPKNSPKSNAPWGWDEKLTIHEKRRENEAKWAKTRESLRLGPFVHQENKKNSLSLAL